MQTTVTTTLETLVGTCIADIETRHGAREQAIVTSRALVRQCANAIRAAHRLNHDEAARLLAQASDTATALRAAVADYPDLLSAGYTQDALKEFVEASVVLAFLTDGAIPSPDDLHVPSATYLNGLAEAASELRRTILDRLRRNETTTVETLLAYMDEVYSLLVTVDYPDALTGGLRRTTDSLRAVLERTRGDVTAALRQEQLTRALATFEQRVTQHHTGTPD